jgi:hypothetical protein
MVGPATAGKGDIRPRWNFRKVDIFLPNAQIRVLLFQKVAAADAGVGPWQARHVGGTKRRRKPLKSLKTAMGIGAATDRTRGSSRRKALKKQRFQRRSTPQAALLDARFSRA